MQEVFEKIIEQLKSEVKRWEDSGTEYKDKCEIAVGRGLRNAIEIVKQEAEKCKSIYMNGEYCWQSCWCTDRCGECNRLCNGDIDYYESYDAINNGWIPVDEGLPETDKYILLSFSNFSIPCVGRYEEDENGGAFYIGDDDETCVSQDMFVNAWMNLPSPYQPKGE